MKRIGWTAVLLAGTLSSGCLTNGFVTPDKPAAKPVEPARPAERPPVVAAQINGANAQEKAQSLREELDRDMERAIEAGNPKPEKK
jgi:hypothetical protein